MLQYIWLTEPPVIDPPDPPIDGTFSYVGNPQKQYYVKITNQLNVPWAKDVVLGVYNPVTSEFDFTELTENSWTLYEMSKGYPFPFDKNILSFVVES